MYRKVINQVQGYRTQDGAGVSLVRVLGNRSAQEFDPFLMFDAFDISDKKDFEAGFPMHPHRGIETLTYIAKGEITHRDHLGTEMTVKSGEAQWLCAGSGAFHEEMPGGEHLMGAQLWLNLPAKDKMSAEPFYHGITNDQIKEFSFDGGKLRLITGSYNGEKGFEGKYLPLDYYDILLNARGKIDIDVPLSNSVFIFTLVGEVVIDGTLVKEKTAARLSDGDRVKIEACDKNAQVLFISSKKLGESIAWYGPIVMNTEQELRQAVQDLNDGTFVKQRTSIVS